MSMDVHGQLDRLAQRAPQSGPPNDLWRRGVRRRRRRTVTVAAAALSVALVAGLGAGTAGADWNRLATVQPAGSTARPAIPTRVERPSPATPGTRRAGAPGRLAVVAGAARRTGILGVNEGDGLIGVSATTGRYRFLDLPGALSDSSGLIDTDTPVALSPTGRYVAYWLGGLPAVGARFGETAVGAAVYDTVTGRVRRAPVSSHMGLTPQQLAWVDDSTLLFGFSTLTRRDESSSAAQEAPVRVWKVTAGPPTVLRDGDDLVSGSVAATASGVSSWDGSDLALWSADSGAWTRRTIRVHGLPRNAGLGNAILAPDERRVAIVSQEDTSSTGVLYVGRVPGASVRLDARRVDLGGIRLQSVAGWRDATHVLVQGWTAHAYGVYTVDVGTGAARLSVAMDRQGYTPGTVFASALWRIAPVRRPGPSRVLDPRLLAAGGGLLALALVGGLVRVRRRRAVL